MKKNFIIYFIGTIVVASLNFILIPFITKYLTPAEYGVVAMYQVVLGFSKPFVGFVLESNIYRVMIKYSKLLVSKVIGATIIIVLANTLFFYFFIFLFYDILNYFIPLNKELYLLIPVVAMSYSIISIFEHILIIKKKAKQFVIMQIGTKMLSYGFSLYFLILLKLGYYSLIFGELISVFFITLVILSILYKKQFLQITKNRVLYRQSYAFGFPLVASAIGVFGLQMIDRIFILHLIDAKAVGIYSIAYQFGMAINMFYTSINKVWSPWVFENIKNKFNKRTVVKITYSMVLFFIIIYFMFIKIVDVVFPYLVNTKFYDAINLIPIIALGYLFYSFYILVIPYVIYMGKTNKMFYITISSFLLNCILNYILIPIFGMKGAAFATVASFVLTFILTFILSNKVYHMPWLLNLKKADYDS